MVVEKGRWLPRGERIEDSSERCSVEVSRERARGASAIPVSKLGPCLKLLPCALPAMQGA